MKQEHVVSVSLSRSITGLLNDVFYYIYKLHSMEAFCNFFRFIYYINLYGYMEK